jgi:site-specific DNA-methyltransferase (adenine-specific)
MIGMARYPDKYFDLAIVDPPFGIGNFIQTTGRIRGNAVKWNDAIPSADYFQELRRVSKHQIIWGANYYNCFEPGKGAIVWFKHVPDECHMSACTLASCTMQKRITMIDLPWSNINRGETMIHPCQMPVDLYRILLKTYAKPGDKILDTHVGSASSLIACYDMGFNAVGFELDADYYKASMQRLTDFMAQPRLEEMITERSQISL